ncbi:MULTISPECIES: ABC transporter substrate-binding protein [unclassified Comamonas]|uniref:ABC transporter substrate-binding protein n=1 Tax=unclassified Comamonas TaxID=2638500 RepID=UPI00289CEF86|nr:ABC transporter substrate-binding protein [Comamonas sp.]
MTYQHICPSSHCDCGISRRDWLRIAAISGVAASPLLRAGDALAQKFKGDDVPVRIGYLAITDATPFFVAHSRKLFEAEGLQAEKPRLFRSWAQLIEAFIAGQVNVVHLLSPTTLSVRYGSKFGAKVVAWNHMSGSAITVAPNINSVADLAGTTFAIPFWYSIHNILIQQVLRKNGLTPVSKPKGTALGAKEVNLVIVPPAEMVAALASKSVSGFIVADPFNAVAETMGVGKVARFLGDIWKDHACCLVTLSERDIAERPEWAQRVTTAIVKAQLWTREHMGETAELMSKDGANKYTPHPLPVLQKVFDLKDFEQYRAKGVLQHPAWNQRRIDFQPYPFPSYTQELVKAMQGTLMEGNVDFIRELDPAFAARDLVDDRFVKQALSQVGGLKAFGHAEDFSRKEVIEA